MMSQADTTDDRIPSGTREEPDYQGDESFLDDGQFTGNELDEEREAEPQSISSEENAVGAKGVEKRKKWLWPGIALILFLSMGFAYLVVTHEYLAEPPQEKKIIPQHLTLPVSEHKRVDFHSLVIPFNKSDDFTYLSFRISFYVPNNKVRDEIEDKKVQLTGIMYDMVARQVNRDGKIPPLETLKELIVRKVNSLLTMGKVKEAYITKMLAV
jgi:flagellar basal body-associated protein FliL